VAAVATAQHVFARIFRGELGLKTFREFVDAKIAIAGALVVGLGDFGITGMSALRAFEFSGIAVAGGHAELLGYRAYIVNRRRECKTPG